MKVGFYTLGCRLNQAETDQYAEQLAEHGFAVVGNDQSFDIAIINTCAVTHKADREGRQAIRKLKRQCPKAKIVMTGCSNFELDEVDYYIKDKENFVEEFVSSLSPQPPLRDRKRASNLNNKTRANIKIQTGCDNNCTYCITTQRRGKSRSFKADQIINNINKKVKQGYKEIVLTGVNIGQYQALDQDLKMQGLTGLISLILKKTKIQRIRLSSINPEYIYKNKEFKNLFNNKRLCRHLHMSLQSGSDAVLKRMNRHYSSHQYLEIVQDYYKKYSDFGFTTDVIVGFPGEGEKEFEQTCSFVKKCGFLKIHVFRYSPREGTAAAIMENQVDEEIKKQRSKTLQKVNQDLQDKFKKKMKGKKLEVLFEAKRGDKWIGHAGNYLLVEKKSKKDLENQIVKIKILRFIIL